MTKGVVILKALIAKRRLKEICQACNISYKYCHAVSEEIKQPSLDLMKKLQFLVPLDFWVDEANQSFLNQIKENIVEDE